MRSHPLLPVLAASVVAILACGGLRDSGWEEPECDADCPNWTLQIDDNRPKDSCFSTCAPLVECPSWGIPLITDTCYACTHITESGKLLPLVPNLGFGSFDQACSPSSADANTTQVLWWIDENYYQDGEYIWGDVHIVWTSGETGDTLCDVRYEASFETITPRCPECIVEFGAVLTWDSYDGPYCDAILSQHRYDFADQADGGVLSFGYAREWTAWDGSVHNDVIFRSDDASIYEASPWIPYSQATDVGEILSNDVPASISTHELWASEWVPMSLGSGSSYRTTRPIPEHGTSPSAHRLTRP